MHTIISDFPRGVHEAIGAFVSGAPLVCGGLSTVSRIHYNDCHAFDMATNSWRSIGLSMFDQRARAGATLLVPTHERKKKKKGGNSGGPVWWVGGGHNGKAWTRTSELYTLAKDGGVGGFSSGPDLGFTHQGYGMCLVALNATHHFALNG